MLFGYSLTAQISIIEAKKYFQEYETRNLIFSDSLWGISMQSPVMILENSNKKVFLNEFVVGAVETEGFFEVPLDSFNVSLTEPSVWWRGKKWVVLNVSKSRNEDQNLEYLFHESFHLIQDSLGINGTLPKYPHFSQPRGLFLMYLEIYELIHAFNTKEKTSQHLSKALSYREYRNRLFPNLLNLERAAELNEGLAKYTGLVYTGASEIAISKYYVSTLEKSILINSEGIYPYLSGSLYAFINDKTSNLWRLKVPQLYLDEICKQLYKVDNIGEIVDFNDTSFFTNEDLKLLEKLEKRVNSSDSLKEYFSEDILSLHLSGAKFKINSNFVFSLDEMGTVYNSIVVSNDWGVLKVFNEGRALVTKDNTSILLSSKNCYLSNSLIEGDFWELRLSTGWEFIEIEDKFYIKKEDVE